MKRYSLLFLFLVLQTGCDDNSAGTKNSPPVFTYEWSSSPQVSQGTTVVLDLFSMTDPDGDEFTASLVSSDSGLEITLDEEMSFIELHADYQVKGDQQVEVVLEDVHGAAETYTFNVTVLPLRWVDEVTWSVADGPEAREHGSVIMDVEGGRILLITGSGYNPYMEPLDDVWQYSLGNETWTALVPAGDAPAGGGSKRVAQVPGQRVAYLFGGYGTDGAALGDLYRVDFSGDGVEFILLEQTDSPGARFLHSFAYDPELDRFVMFGGMGAGGENENDTWVMTLDDDTAVWEELDTTDPPTPRYGFFYGFDRATGRLIVYSGAQGMGQVDPATDTWILDTRQAPAQWQLIAQGEDEGVPPGRRNGCMIYDDDNTRLFVFGGTPDAQITAAGLFVLDARPGKESWTLLDLDDEPALRSSGFGFHNPAGKCVSMGFGNTTTAVYADWNVLGY